MRRLCATITAMLVCLALTGLPVMAQETSPATSSAEPELTPARSPTLPPARPSDLNLTIHYDNVSGSPELRSHWGFAALVE